MSRNSKKRTNSNLSEESVSNPPSSYNKKRKSNGTEQQPEPQPIIIINKEIKSLNDLIELGLSYEVNKRYNVNLKKLNKITPLLIKLRDIIGMESVKKSIIGQILYFLQDFQSKNEDMLHTVIQGPPGVGKTMLGHIIGQIYWELDIIQSPEDVNKPNNIFSSSNKDDYCQDDDCQDDDYLDDDYKDDDYNDIINLITRATRSSTRNQKKKEFKFKIAKRSDLIGKYLGHTAAQTQKVIDSALGGVLFIDEAYSLGNAEGRDSFAKECIDTINQNLTEKKNQLLVIIAGYEEALDTCFFSYNEGLNRRFPFRYTIESYTHEELAQIFIKMVGEINKEPNCQWTTDVSNSKLNLFFKDNYKLFPNFGGDIETFLLSVKIQHGIRVFCLSSDVKKKIIYDDLTNALKIYRVNKEIKDKVSDIQKYIHNTMYS
jgi:SpoVK/Ycf46/Vps4 family AAA+-type ATPase